MINAIIGYTGFVGKNLLKFIKFDYLYNSKNINDIDGLVCDNLYFCALPAQKWYANKYPQKDYDNMKSIMEHLKTITVNKFILISTIDVYDDITNNANEPIKPNYESNHAYGKHRYLFEQWVKKMFDNHLIVRLPALFGKGLKKNVIYDLINHNQIDFIPINSSFQWYDIDWLYDDICICVENNISLCNLFTEPLDTCDIIELFNYDKKLFHNNVSIHYNLTTSHGRCFGLIDNYIRSKNTVRDNIIKYINDCKPNTRKYSLAVSNICNNFNHRQFYALLNLYGITHVEVAYTKYFDWNNISFTKLEQVKALIEEHNLKLYSTQSITYNAGEFNIFDSSTRDNLFDHLKKVIKLSGKLGVTRIVFGCPKNRRMLLNSHIDEAIFFFKRINTVAKQYNVYICIENNSTKYNSNFINTMDEVLEFVRTINGSHVKAMCDLGNMIMENDDLKIIKNNLHLIEHIHISQPYMQMFTNPDKLNIEFASIVADYDKVITLEMLNKNNTLHVQSTVEVGKKGFSLLQLAEEESLKYFTSSLQNFTTIY